MSFFNIITYAKNMDSGELEKGAALLLTICFLVCEWCFWKNIEKWRKWHRDLSEKSQQLIAVALFIGYVGSLGGWLYLAWRDTDSEENKRNYQEVYKYLWEHIWPSVVLFVFFLYLFLGLEPSILYIRSKLNNKPVKCEVAVIYI